jgi:hypothetical protein
MTHVGSCASVAGIIVAFTEDISGSNVRRTVALGRYAVRTDTARPKLNGRCEARRVRGASTSAPAPPPSRRPKPDNCAPKPLLPQ